MTNSKAENAKVKRAYMRYLREAEGKDIKTLDRALSAICEFEESTGGKAFKAFHINQAIKFKEFLGARKSRRTGHRLALSTIDVTLRQTKQFFIWLAGQPGYKSRISYTDAEYFSNTLKKTRAAQAMNSRSVPSLEQVRYALECMPKETDLNLRDRALLSLFALTGARIQAVASLRFKHLVLNQRRLLQDARVVNTKNGKTMDTTFFPVGEEFVFALEAYVERLKSELHFGPDDPLFPRQASIRTENGFAADGLSRTFYRTANPLNLAVKAAFENAQLPLFTPHSFRHMLADLGSSLNLNPKEFKAWSVNLGHENVTTTVSSYLQVTPNEQRELMQRLIKR
ncbi:MAG: site-specific integrase [Shimia sp.]|uniref:tyrosine-type recombinase/integrase n=1 Tax=Shimia sp. TaxID=1954381 RepID=UPI001B102F5B|nr:site-specific integrase [Shimia sp.]MBO6899116.1 site-specific integrase [Shimia sp.]